MLSKLWRPSCSLLRQQRRCFSSIQAEIKKKREENEIAIAKFEQLEKDNESETNQLKTQDKDGESGTLEQAKPYRIVDTTPKHL